MYEKFSILEVDSAGSGGEYTVQVGLLYVIFSFGCGVDRFPGWIRVDKRSRALDREHVWQCFNGPPVPNSIDYYDDQNLGCCSKDWTAICCGCICCGSGSSSTIVLVNGDCKPNKDSRHIRDGYLVARRIMGLGHEHPL